MKVFYKIVIAIMVGLFLLSGNVKVKALATKEMVDNTYPLVVTNRNYANFSSDKNFIILLVDCIDSKRFYKELSKSKYKDHFKDFTYYPDTTSYFIYTRESIPQILTGIPNYNEDEYKAYYNKAFDKSFLMDELIKNDYDINIFDHELMWSSKKGRIVQNVDNVANETGIVHSFKCGLKYVADHYFSYLYNIMPGLKFINCNSSSNNSNEIDYNLVYSWDDIDNYNYILNSNVTITEKKQFKFVHVNGAHAPYNIDQELNRVSEKNASYESELNASIKLVSAYIDMLKANNVYDNSVIMVMADHGYAFGETIGRQNPILFIKGMNEVNDDLILSDKKISYVDLNDAYKLLLDGNKSSDLFPNITGDRVRNIIWYEFRKENHMVEYKLDGHAWENKKLKKTGKEYNR